MPGLLAASWRKDQAGRAHELFELARDAYTRLKGLPCNSDVTEGDFRVARFAATQSPYPDVFRMPEIRLILASAGWWFDPDAPEDARPSLIQLADRYLRENTRMFDRLQGQYLIVSIDLGEYRLTASGDHLGLFPFYVSDQNGTALVSTSALALATALKPRLDVEALRALFMNDDIRSPRTPFEGIRRVAFGERVTLGAGRSHVHRVWIPYQSPRACRNVEDAAAEGITLLHRCCRRIRQVWPRWVSDLTSGLDSRLVVAAMVRQGGPVNITVSGPFTHLDVKTAHTIAARFGWPLHYFDRPPDWGQKRWSFFKQGIALAEGGLAGHNVDGVIPIKLRLRDSFDAALNGNGGPFYRDFFWQQELLRIGKTSSLDVSRLLRYRLFFKSRPEISLFRNDWTADYAADQGRVAQEIANMAPDALNTAKLDAIFIWKMSGGSHLFGAIFPILPSLTPLATAELVEYAIALPWRFRLHGGLARQMITAMNPQLAAIPTWYGGSAEPISISHPRQYFPFQIARMKKLVRKVGQLTIDHPIFSDPTSRQRSNNWNRDFVAVLEKEGFLDIDNLRTTTLYSADNLRRFLSRTREHDFNSFDQLYSIISVELLCQLCGITPSNQAL